MKVYCSGCKYYNGDREVIVYNIFYSIFEVCEYPKNLKNNYYKENNLYKKLPSEINKRNNCKWFEEKK